MKALLLKQLVFAYQWGTLAISNLQVKGISQWNISLLLGNKIFYETYDLRLLKKKTFEKKIE